jgi:nucleoside-diphosphate-sugar epimerase
VASRVILTGASGFVGRQICTALVGRGHQVIALSRHQHGGRGGGESTKGVQWLCADLLGGDDLAGLMAQAQAHHLIHAAWEVGHGTFWQAPENFVWQRATDQLAQAFYAAGGQRFVGLGSCAEYDWSSGAVTGGTDLPWSESRALVPGTIYGQAKAQTGTDLLALAQKMGTSAAWVRLFHLFGPGEPAARLVPSIIENIRLGRVARCGSGRAVRDFVSTWFAARAIVAVMESPVDGAINVGSGCGVRIADLAQDVANLLMRPDLLHMGALADRSDDVAWMVADTTRLRRVVGFDEAPDLLADLTRMLHR